MTNKKTDKNYYHVVELNRLGDHVVIKTFALENDAKAFVKVMQTWAEDGEEYYVQDIRTEW